MDTFQFPLDLTFKIMAVAPQVLVRDAAGQPVCYVRQKVFKLKEKIDVYTDPDKSTVLARIEADRIIDFSATYRFTDPEGNPFGLVRRKGMKSFWRTHYEIEDATGNAYTVREANPMAKVMAGFFSGIPIIGGLSGYVFHPRYEIKDAGDALQYVLTKQPAFFEGKFRIEKPGDSDDDVTILMAIIMAVLLKRQRG